MKKYLYKLAATVILSSGFMASAHAIPVTINMTADNIVSSGGLCFDASCQDGIDWTGLTSASNWQQSDTVTFDIGAGTPSFAWNVTTYGAG